MYISHIHIYGYDIHISIFTQPSYLPSLLGLLNTPTASLLRSKTPLPTSVLNMTLNNLMVRFQ